MDSAAILEWREKGLKHRWSHTMFKKRWIRIARWRIGTVCQSICERYKWFLFSFFPLKIDYSRAIHSCALSEMINDVQNMPVIIGFDSISMYICVILRFSSWIFSFPKFIMTNKCCYQNCIDINDETCEWTTNFNNKSFFLIVCNLQLENGIEK